MRRAFTIIELLCCVAIVLVVAAISYPVFAAVERNAKISTAQSNLRQLYMAFAIYRSDEGGDGIYGDPAAMGLPPVAPHPGEAYDLVVKPYPKLLKSGCGLNPSWYVRNSWEPPESPIQEIIYRPADVASYGAYAAKYRSSSLLFYDLNCDDPGTPLYNVYLKHRGIAVLVEGQAVNNYKPGLMSGNDAWWSVPEGGAL